MMLGTSISMLAALVLTPVLSLASQDTLVHIRNLAPRSLRTAYFRLDSAQEIRIAAVGGEPIGRSAMRRFLDNGVFQAKEAKTWDAGVWPANAWILDARSRKVVWELRTARTSTNDDGLRGFDALVRLPAGTYEASYAALFPVSRFWTDDDDWRVRNTRNERPAVDQLHGPYLDDGTYRRFQMLIRGAGQRVTEEVAHGEATSTALFTLRGSRPDTRERIGFELDRALPIEIYVVGEGEDSWYDYGWIMDASTRRVVWTSRNGPGEPAGGARKNRMVRQSMELPAGKYVAVYVTDNAHQLSAWNETPPYDPFSWGLSVLVASATDRAAARTFEYQPIPTTDAFVRLTRLGDEELRWQRFSVSRPIDIQVFALGEATGRSMHDLGWIVDAAGRAVWRMEYDATEHGGGSEKNRVFTGNIRLPAGRFTAYFVTDGSHSFGDGWNSDEPMDGDYWGITLAPLDPKRDAAAVKPLADSDPETDPAVLAQLTRVRDDREDGVEFTLASRAAVRVYALGEGTGSMVDYATIEDRSGREVWRMTYAETEEAGGAKKNRRVDRTMMLEAGTYTVRFRTDDSHGWKDWNAPPPDDPLAWGVTVFRAGTPKQ